MDKIKNGVIYRIRNLINGKVYIGMTTKGLKNRWKKHLYNARKDETNNKFYNAINKYGKDNFEVMVIETGIKSFRQLKELEIYYIGLFNSFINGYNSTLGGDGCVGYKHTPEAIEKIIETSTGRIHSEETKRRISEALRGRTLTNEHKQKISKGLNGKEVSLETRRKISQSMKGNKNQRTVSIYQVSKQYEIVNVFETIADANVYIGRNANHGAISKCINGKQISTGGYYWVSLKDYYVIF